jgi:hypothetical protein
MESIHFNVKCSDRGHYAVSTRWAAIENVQLVEIVDPLRRNPEEPTLPSSQPPIVSDCRIAGVTLGFAFHLAPVRIWSSSIANTPEGDIEGGRG